VQDGEDTETSWEYGVPNNALATSAHSPTHAWGINLDGMSSAGYVQTFLVSPAVDLRDGNVATLKFWQNYDFSADSVLEVGQLLLFTNTQTQPITLQQYGGDATFGWEQEEFDLSPYVGTVVQLVWSYEMFDIDEVEHPGWLIDDVELTLTNVLRGTIRVTNNIAASSFTLSGPATYEGSGRSYTNALAAPGTYTITWNDIPYYRTPPPQTNQLVANGTLSFSGAYLFDDANQNGIPDPWETQYFGEVSPSRSAATDTDGDGASDFAEFVAGTDPTVNSSSLTVQDVQLLANNRAQATWSAAPGKTYVIMGSTDGVTWQRYSGELHSTTDQMQADILLPPDSTMFFFEIQVLQ
jgi:hypothetical protein